MRYLQAVRAAGLRTRGGVVQREHRRGAAGRPASTDLFEARVDGVVAARASTCAGKPAPDTFLAGAEALGVDRRRRPPSSRTRSPGSRPAGRAASARGRRGPGRAGRRAARSTAPTSSSTDLAELLRRARRDHATVSAFPSSLVHPRDASSTWTCSAQTESVFALSNGHIGLRGNLDEGEPHGLPGTYLNSVLRAAPAAVRRGRLRLPRVRPDIINVTNGKLIRLLVDDEPFDVRYGELPPTSGVLDLRAGTLRRDRRVDARRPAGRSG